MLAVVVGEHGAGAHVDVLADDRVTAIGQVGHLGVLADLGVLRLHEGADLAAHRQLRAGTQPRPRAHIGPGTDHGQLTVGADHLRVLTDLDVLQGGVGADRGAGSNGGGPQQLRARQQGDVLLQGDVALDPGGGGIGDGDALQHPVLTDAPIHLGVHPRQLHAIVDALGLPGVLGLVGAHGMVMAVGVLDHVGEIELALRVVGAQAGQAATQQVGVEDIDPRVDLGDEQFVGVGVLVLDDAQHLMVLAHHPAVAGGIVDVGGEHGGGIVLGVVGVDQRLQRGTRQHGDVAVGDHHVTAQVGGQCIQPDAHRITGAVLLFLHGDGCLGGDLGQVLLDLGALVTHHHHQALGFQGRGCPQRAADHRLAGNLVEDLRGARLHARALAGGQHDHGRDTRHGGGVTRALRGGPFGMGAHRDSSCPSAPGICCQDAACHTTSVPLVQYCLLPSTACFHTSCSSPRARGHVPVTACHRPFTSQLPGQESNLRR